MARSLLVFALLFLAQIGYAQRRISLYEMRYYVDRSFAIAEKELKNTGFVLDDDETDDTIGDWGIVKHYIDDADTRLSLTINKKLGQVRAATVYSTDKLQYQRMLSYLEWGNFKKIVDRKKNSVTLSDRFADLWKDASTNYKVIIKYKASEDQEPYEIEISKDITYTNLEK
jgi:hypothetical protein